MTPPAAAMDLGAHLPAAEDAIRALIERGLAQPGVGADGANVEAELRVLAKRVIDRWSTFIAEACSSARSLTRVLGAIGRLLGFALLGGFYSAAGRNCSCSVDSCIAVVEDWPPVMAIDTASK